MTGLGRVITTVRSAIAGIELSTEFSVVSMESFSMRGARMLPGIFVTRGARLQMLARNRIDVGNSPTT